MSFKILHLSPDDKFIPLQQDLFESAFPGSNRFRILVNPGKELTYSRAGDGLMAVGEEYFSSPAAKADLDDSDCVICHSMRSAFVDAFDLIPDTTLVVWSAWGFEYVHLLEERYGAAMLDRTQRLCRSILWRKRMKKAVTPSGLRDLVGNLGRKVRGTSEDQYGLPSVAHRLDVVSINASDLPRIKAVLPAISGVSHLLPYYTTEDTLEKGPAEMCGPDILLGNSATPTNNHLEAFEELRNLDLRGRRVVTPLSYGDMEYADRVCRLGTRWLGSSFAPLRDFLTLEEFNREVARCGTVVMNHVRQQAIGTISSALYKRAQVYLRPESLLFGFFRGLGIRVQPVSELGNQVWDESRRGDPAGDENSRLIGEFWSRERAVSQIRLLSQFHEERQLARGLA